LRAVLVESPTFSILSCFLCMGVESNQWSQQAMHQSFNQLWSLSPIPFRFSIWPLITLLAIGLQQRVTTSWNKKTPKWKVIELILKSLFHTDYTDICRTPEYVSLTGKTFCNSLSNIIWFNNNNCCFKYVDPFVFDKEAFEIYNTYNYFINKFRTFDILLILDDLFKTSSKNAARLKVKKIRNW